MLATAIVLSLAIGVLLGLLGGGGSILTVPLLVYVLGEAPEAAIATSLVVVGATAAVAALQHAREGHVRWRIGLGFGAAGMVGAHLAGRAAVWFSGTTLLLLFAAMMLATSLKMLVGRRVPDQAPRPPQPAWRIAVQGLVVGSATGLVGAGGGFLIVPALALLGGLPMQEAIGTSLLVIAMQSAAGYLGHAAHVAIDVPLALVVTGAAVVGSFAGTRLASRLPAAALRRGFGAFVLLMAVLVFVREAPAPMRAMIHAVPLGGWVAIGAGVAAALGGLAWSAVRGRLRQASGA